MKNMQKRMKHWFLYANVGALLVDWLAMRLDAMRTIGPITKSSKEKGYPENFLGYKESAYSLIEFLKGDEKAKESGFVIAVT